MNCPKCDDQRLTTNRVGEIEVDHCHECGGLWLDRSELPKLLEANPADVKTLRRGSDRQNANSRRGKCPRCSKDLLRISSALKKQVTVDSCPDCEGVWLDGGEFNELFEEKNRETLRSDKPSGTHT